MVVAARHRPSGHQAVSGVSDEHGRGWVIEQFRPEEVRVAVPVVPGKGQARSMSGLLTTSQARSGELVGALAGRWIHCASNSTLKPAPVRSRSAKLSLTQAPGAAVSIRSTSAAASVPGTSVTASG